MRESERRGERDRKRKKDGMGSNYLEKVAKRGPKIVLIRFTKFLSVLVIVIVLCVN